METVTSTVAGRAYAMAEMWANDPGRLAALLKSEMQPAEFSEICEHLAKAFGVFTDVSVSREATARAFWLHMSMIHGIVVERVFLPVAERLAKKDHDEREWSAGFAPVQIANAQHTERLAA